MYTGRWYNTATGLYDYRFRMVDPTLGRFLQSDPAGTIDGMNLYAYVNNNPLNFIDPDGHSWLSKAWKKIKGWVGTIVTVAFTPWLGPLAASILGSAIGTLVNGGTFKSFAIGVGIGFAAGVIAGGFFGGAEKFATWADKGIMNAFAAGAMTGAIAGGISSAIYGGNWGSNILQGAAAGLIGAGIGMATRSAINKLITTVKGMSATKSLLASMPIADAAAITGSFHSVYEPTLTDLNYESTVNVNGGIDHTYEETMAIIESGKESWSPDDHLELGRFDFKLNRPHDTFIISPGANPIGAAGFGNYIAGYLATYHLGSSGLIGMRMGGNLIANQPGWNFIYGDNAGSIKMINLGALDATCDHPIRVFWKTTANDPVKIYRILQSVRTGYNVFTGRTQNSVFGQ